MCNWCIFCLYLSLKGGVCLKKLIVLALVSVLSVAVFANPFVATQEGTATIDFGAIGTSMQGYFSQAMPTIVLILGISIGVPWAIRMFRRAAR